MIFRTALLFAASCTLSAGFVRSGKATADWWTSSVQYKPGQPVETAIRLDLDDGWHTYWSNPGEGGMKLSVTWELPPGWTASEPAHPVPKRFKTGDLAGFGYEGEVLFPVTLTPPPDLQGQVNLVAKVSWLTCDDSACVPGEGELTLTLLSGKPGETANSRAIEAARKLVPQPLAGSELEVSEDSGELTLRLRLPEAAKLDLAASEIFPATPQAIDPAAEFKFTETDDGWLAKVPKNEYASERLKALTLVIASEGAPPAEVSWQAK